MKICEIFSGNSFKEDLSIDATFDPCYFSWDSPFKATVQLKLKGVKATEYAQQLVYILFISSTLAT